MAGEVNALRWTMWRNGYRPLAVLARDKVPIGKNWPELARKDPPDCLDKEVAHATNTGTLCDGLRPVDLDIDNAELMGRVAKLAYAMLGVTIAKWRDNSPRCTLVYRAAPWGDGPAPGKLSLAGASHSEAHSCRIEVLGRGQQFVAFGTHPSGAELRWHNGSPADRPLDSLPAVTEAQLQAFLAAAGKIIGAPEPAPKPGPKGGNGAAHPEGAPSPSGFFARVNAAAMADLAAWVPHLFPAATHQSGTGAWRVTSRERGRPDLQEDISFHPDGIQDYGEERPMTPIDAVVAFGSTPEPAAAALFLCRQLGVDPATWGWQRSNGKDHRPAPETEPPPSRVGRINSGELFMNRFTPPDWLIAGILQSGRLYACTSRTGHGKTAVWLTNACMIHAGRMIGQLTTTQGNVLILAGENPEDLKARMIGMVQHFGIEPSQMPYVLPASFPLDEDEIEALKKEIDQTGVAFAMIVGDTSASFFPGDDENDNVQAGAYARRLRSLTDCAGNPAVVMLSHPVKNASRDSLLPRGGGAFLNELDGNFTLWSESIGEVTSLHWNGKIRGADFNPLGYGLKPVDTGYRDNFDQPVMTVIAEPMSPEAVVERAREATRSEDVVLYALRDYPGITVTVIAERAGWIEANGTPDRKRVYRAMENLREDKLIEQERTRGPWSLTQKGKKVANAAEDE